MLSVTLSKVSLSKFIMVKLVLGGEGSVIVWTARKYCFWIRVRVVSHLSKCAGPQAV